MGETDKPRYVIVRRKFSSGEDYRVGRLVELDGQLYAKMLTGKGGWPTNYRTVADARADAVALGEVVEQLYSADMSRMVVDPIAPA
jgi:hypothetical protein